jgi:lipoate-protein ligase A
VKPAGQSVHTSTPEVWRLLPEHVGEPLAQVNLTERLVRTVARDGPSVWWHSTEGEAILVGPGMYMAHRPNSIVGVPVIRRNTGGGAVLTGKGLWAVDIALPASHPMLSGDILRDYQPISRLWEETLTRVGLDVRCISIEESRTAVANYSLDPDIGLVCFGHPAPYEILSGNRKLVGLSQVRKAGGVVFSSAIHTYLSPSSIATVLPLSSARKRRLAAHLRQVSASLSEIALSPPDIGDISRAFRESLLARYGVTLSRGEWIGLDLG